MKKIFTIISIIFSSTLFAQNGEAVVDALKTADVNKFTSYLDNSVDLKLPQKGEIKNVSKSDASSTITAFFSSANINGFDVISQREMSGTMYIAGKLKGASQNYNITVMIKNKGDELTIITIRIS